MTPSSLLGSWIDMEAAAMLARDLCTPDRSRSAAAPLRFLVETSFLKETGAAEPSEVFARPEGSAPTSAPALHSRLTEIKERARKNGLLGEDETLASSADAEVSPAPTQTVRASAERRVPSTENPAASGAPRPFIAPLGTMMTRLRALADWMHESFAPQALFVTDEQGQPLAEFRCGAELLAASSLLAEAAQRARKHLPDDLTTAVIHVPLAPELTLSLVTSETVLGRWNAGLTSRMPLDPHSVRALARAVKKTAEVNS